MPIQAGTRFGPYEIVSLIGAGGMGQVWKALDTRLGRIVALKILPPHVASEQSRIQRFTREAHAASRLNHPNVATIYDIGQSAGVNFIAMEYVEGQTLAEKIGGQAVADPAQIIEIGKQVADVLDAAHDKGITHRDIKPANLMLTPQGQVKVLDFGLAKIAPHQEQAAMSAVTDATGTLTGMIMGTVAYMSPEQVLGSEVDHRTDIFSLGVVLYEMATGRPPFVGRSTGETIDRILHAQPAPIASFNAKAPAELERIVRKCTEKNRDHRYQSARELLVDLENLHRGSNPVSGVQEHSAMRHRTKSQVLIALGLGLLLLMVIGLAVFTREDTRLNERIDSVAVLPFINATGDPDADYLSDGITETLINTLSRLPNLRVIPRAGVFRYKGRSSEVNKVGLELKVRTVVTGRATLRGDTLSIQAELVDVANGRQLWGERYDRKRTDILKLQDEIANSISQGLRLQLSGDERQRISRHYTENGDAYQLYLRGRYYLNRSTPDDMRKSIDYFNQALAIDRNYALAYAGLADVYLSLSALDPSSASIKEAIANPKPYIEIALRLDPELAEAYVSLANYDMTYERDYKAAEQGFKRAIQLNDNLAMAHLLYGELLSIIGRPDEAIIELRRAVTIDPVSALNLVALGYGYYIARQYDEAIEESRKAQQLNPNFFGGFHLMGQTYGQQGKYRQATEELTKARNLQGGYISASSELAYIYATSGDRAEAQKILEDLRQRAKQEYVNPYFIAIIHVGLGEPEDAFALLNQAVDTRDGSVLPLRVEPKFGPLRSDPRFDDLVRRMGSRK